MRGPDSVGFLSAFLYVFFGQNRRSAAYEMLGTATALRARVRVRLSVSRKSDQSTGSSHALTHSLVTCT